MKTDFLNSHRLHNSNSSCSKTKSYANGIYSCFSHIDIRSHLKSTLLKIKNVYYNTSQSACKKINLFGAIKPERLICPGNLPRPNGYCDLLSRNSKRIQNAYSLGKNLLFKEMHGGIVNPPVLVFEKEKKMPLGVFKAELGKESTANIRLDILSNLKSKGYVHLPEIYKNSKGRHLTKIEGVFFYFMQFLAQDPSTISFEHFLAATGELHRHTKWTSYTSQLGNAKLDEYRSRSHLFLDPWFLTCDPIFSDPLWQDIIELSQYFNSQAFQRIYQNLPIQLIHGDNNQTNIIVSSQIPYFIDFDSLRFDARILDLTSYFRYGGFEQYITLTGKKELISIVDAIYGKHAGALSQEEKNNFHLIVAFSHIEFVSWAMKMLKKHSLDGNEIKTNECLQYIVQYKKQLSQILEILKQSHSK